MLKKTEVEELNEICNGESDNEAVQAFFILREEGYTWPSGMDPEAETLELVERVW